MQVDLIIETAHRLPTSSALLIFFMALSASLIASHFMEVSILSTIAATSALYFSGLLSCAAFAVGGVVFSLDKPTNVVVASAFGFVALAAIHFFTVHGLMRLRDKL